MDRFSKKLHLIIGLLAVLAAAAAMWALPEAIIKLITILTWVTSPHPF